MVTKRARSACASSTGACGGGRSCWKCISTPAGNRTASQMKESGRSWRCGGEGREGRGPAAGGSEAAEPPEASETDVHEGRRAGQCPEGPGRDCAPVGEGTKTRAAARVEAE